MKKSILALAACALLAYSTPVQAQKSEGESLLRAALKGWHVGAAFALDRGSHIGDNTGFQLTLSRSGLLLR